MEEYTEDSELHLDDVHIKAGLTKLHERCASHRLNLLGTTDVKKVQELDKAFGKMFSAVLDKCTILWNAVSRSSKAREVYESVMKSSPIRPGQTRWNSLYDALEKIYENKIAVNEILLDLKLSIFKEIEFVFLNEFLLICKPIAVSLDRLQKSSNCFYGEFLPEVLQLFDNLQEIDENSLKYCKNLLKMLKKSLKDKNRFKSAIELDENVIDAIFASISHPFFKTWWLPDDKVEHFRNLFIDQAVKLFKIDSEDKSVESETSKEKEKDAAYFKRKKGTDSASTTSINIQQSQEVIKNAITIEVMQYLLDKNVTVENLSKYPTINQMFKKYNAPLPSSAMVERLFSIAGMIMRPHRRKLSDDIFEKILIMKNNF